jgi:hypothetical protein
VLDWNALAIGFYETLVATMLPEWKLCRMSGAHIEALAAAIE